MRTLKGVVVATAVLAAWATPARADFGPDTYCGGGNFATCASVSLTADNTGSNTVISITVMNLGANGMAGYYDSVFATVGLIGLPAGRTITVTDGADGNGGNWASWDGPPPQDLNGLPTDTYGMRAPSPVPSNGLLVGQSISFTFSIGGEKLTTEQLAAVGVGIHGQAGPNNCSTKLGVVNSNDGTVVTNGPYDPNCSSNVVPEPITMVLLGTGLAGVAGVARRRRNGLEIEDESEA